MMSGRVLVSALSTTLLFSGFVGAAQANSVATVEFFLGQDGQIISGDTKILNGSNPVSPNVQLNTLNHSTLQLDNPNELARTTNSTQTKPDPAYGGYYLAVHAGQSATLNTDSILANGNEVGFTWGTIDTDPGRNTLLIRTSNGSPVIITGAEIYAALQRAGYSPVAGETQADILIIDQYGSIDQLKFSDAWYDYNAFEVANFLVTTTPLPPAMALFGTALAGLAWLGRRRQRKAGAASA